MFQMLHSRKIMFFLAPGAVLLLLLAAILTFWKPFGAHASGQLKLYVGHTVGNNTSCASPGFTSVQAAVNVANTGDVVYLCGTTPYSEQVIITKAITLTGDAGATIAAPSPFPSTSLTSLPPQFTADSLFVPQAIVFVWGAGANATIKNLTITGVMPGNGGCAEDEYGVLVIDGAKVALNNDKVLNIQDSNSSLYGCQFGVAVQIGRQYWPTANFASYITEDFVGHAVIKNTTVAGYQKNGITVDGPGTTASLTWNTVNGAGRNNGNLFSPIIGQNGIEIGRGAAAKIEYNTVTGNSYTGPAPASAGGILVFGGACGDTPVTPLTTNTLIDNNTLADNDVGLYVSNLIVDTNNNCALPTTPTNIQMYRNKITNSAVSNIGGTNLFNVGGGYQAGISDEGYADRITSNNICGVGYTPVLNPPPYLSQIDVVATNPFIKGNTFCGKSQVVNMAPTQTAQATHLHRAASPYK